MFLFVDVLLTSETSVAAGLYETRTRRRTMPGRLKETQILLACDTRVAD